MWRPRDRERYIGSYDPEHEMPDPDRASGDRWQSDAYRNHFRDSRFAYRMNPDRFENQFDGRRRDVDREMQMRWSRDARDREYGNYDEYRGGYGDGGFRDGGGYDRSFERAGYGNDFGFGGRGRAEWGMRGNMDRGYDRGFGGTDRAGWDREPMRFDRDRNYGSDRGWDRPERNHSYNDDYWRRRR